MEKEASYHLTENQKKFVRAAERAGYEVNYGYSGRAMFGRLCPSVVITKVERFIPPAKVFSDSMGLDTVIYARD